MKYNDIKIPKEKFAFANTEGRLRDKELVTKPIGYFKDAFNRFKKNKGSIAGAIIIAILALYAILAPIFSPFTVSYSDPYYRFTLPKVFNNVDWLDGCAEKKSNQLTFEYHYSMGVETGHNAIKNGKFEKSVEKGPGNKDITYFTYRLDSYHQVGTVYLTVTQAQYDSIQKYQDETGIQVIYPAVNPAVKNEKGDYIDRTETDQKDANYWYKTKVVSGKTVSDGVTYNEDGTLTFINNYVPYNGKDNYTSVVRIEENGKKEYNYALIAQDGYKIRVNYYEYYIYQHNYVLKDGIKGPNFIFGTTNYGQDIFTCLASGARFSFILAISVASVNLVVGAIIGAIEGYYGGKIDLIIQRFCEILNSVPFMIVVTLLRYHMIGSSQVLILFISFFLTGWIGMSYSTRMQFYRFKNQEYVLAARTLGAKDRRIMFKHIFPNSLGTLITGCVLIIPGMIFSETSLSYLGIINLGTGNMTSVGTLLSNGQAYLVQYPHMVLYPSIYICLLMLSFNLFGNGLRDAFNPSLRGAED